MTSIANGAGLSAAVLILGIIVFICVLLNSASIKRGLPMLLAFIVFGIACGNIGHIPIYLDDRDYASDVCTVAIIFIMFYGGFGTRWKSAKSVAVESALLAIWMIFAQIIIGTICGLVIAQAGVFLMKRVPFPTSGFDSLMVFAIAIVSYSLPDIIGGNGYLSAYIVGIIMGNSSSASSRKTYCSRSHPCTFQEISVEAAVPDKFRRSEGRLLNCIRNHCQCKLHKY